MVIKRGRSLLDVNIDDLEGFFHEFLDRVLLASGHHVISRLVLLQHQPHALKQTPSLSKQLQKYTLCVQTLNVSDKKLIKYHLVSKWSEH